MAIFIFFKVSNDWNDEMTPDRQTLPFYFLVKYLRLLTLLLSFCHFLLPKNTNCYN